VNRIGRRALSERMKSSVISGLIFTFARKKFTLAPMNPTKIKKQWIKPEVREVRLSMEATAYSAEISR
jgi:coenzyme PQQ precursor peptide PqqA